MVGADAQYQRHWNSLTPSFSLGLQWLPRVPSHQFPQQPFCLFGTVSWGLLEKRFSAEFQQTSPLSTPCLEGSQLLSWLPG